MLSIFITPIIYILTFSHNSLTKMNNDTKTINRIENWITNYLVGLPLTIPIKNRKKSLKIEDSTL